MFPIVVTLGFAKDTKTRSGADKDSQKVSSKKKNAKSKAKRKSRSKKSKSANGGAALDTLETFFTLQGYVVVNLHSLEQTFDRSKVGSGKSTSSKIAASAAAAGAQGRLEVMQKDMACALEKARDVGGNPNQVFLLAKTISSPDALALATDALQAKILPGLRGIVFIEPEGKVRVGNAPTSAFLPVMLVEAGKSEADGFGQEWIEALKSAHIPLRLSFAGHKRKGDLASEIGLATDVVTRDIMDFVRQRLKETTQLSSTNSSAVPSSPGSSSAPLESLAPVPSASPIPNSTPILTPPPLPDP